MASPSIDVDIEIPTELEARSAINVPQNRNSILDKETEAISQTISTPTKDKITIVNHDSSHHKKKKSENNYMYSSNRKSGNDK